MPPPSIIPPQFAQTTTKEVLDEDTYTSTVEAIIERDYFPDLPKLQNQLEWVKAVNSKDPELIRQAQLNIARRRAGLATPSVGATPGAAWGATPGTNLLRTPAMTPLQAGGHATPAPGATPGGGANPAAGSSGLSSGSSDKRAPNMSLDAFLSSYTSEDNASFLKLQEKALQRKRAKHAHHLQDKNQPLLLEGPGSNPIEEYGSSGQQPGTLVLWKHNPRSQLYYAPDQKPLSDKELVEAAKAATKKINSAATRVKPSALEDQQAPAPVGPLQPGLPPAGLPDLAVGGHRDTAASLMSGYNRLSTPAFTPGGEESPFMTWGDIESTPLRLDIEDIPLGPADGGPAFKVQDATKRERAARDLAAKSAVSMQRRATASGVGGATPLLRSLQRQKTPGLSAAAQKLASQLKGKGHTPGQSMDRDKMLRASYRGACQTPSRTPGAATPVLQSSKAATPLLGVGKAGAGGAPPVAVKPRAAAAGAGVGDGAGGAAGSSTEGLTDNLLKL